MTQLDDDIRDALSAEEKELFDQLESDVSLNQMALAPFRTRMRWWTVFAFVQTLVFTGLAIWCAVEFVTAASVDDRVFWGAFMLISCLFTAMLKMWFWMEMNRLSIVREIRRVELQLSAQRG